MDILNKHITEFKPTGKIAEDVPRFLALFGCQKTAQHCAAVAAKAKELAEKFGSNPQKAEQAGYLHDISAVIPNEKKIDFARSWMVEILPEELQYPMIIHQKLSVVIARDVFKITDTEVLSAIGCHTTLKAGAIILDKVVFIADKIAWDQDGQPPYSTTLGESLDAAVLAYMNFLWERRDEFPTIHPWLIEAREELMQKN